MEIQFNFDRDDINELDIDYEIAEKIEINRTSIDYDIDDVYYFY